MLLRLDHVQLVRPRAWLFTYFLAVICTRRGYGRVNVNKTKGTASGASVDMYVPSVRQNRGQSRR